MMTKGFFTDTTLCIGCKACEVACKQWNQLPADGYTLSGRSYDNTGDLGATTWRHVEFIERIAAGANGDGVSRPNMARWLMMSDVCKHCVNAGCLEACPTGAIIRTEFGTVYVQQDICNGCGYCVPSCPFGVIEISEADGRAHKCTLCYDRLQDGLEPACAKACPTDSIQFGDVEELRVRARSRVMALRERGEEKAYIYGDENILGGGLNAFFLLTETAETYNLPANPRLPSDNVLPGFVSVALASVVAGMLTVATILWGKRS